jgi:hypothetical protein
MLDTDVLLKDLKRHVDNDIQEHAVEAARHRYAELGHAKVSFLAPPSVKAAIAEEVRSVTRAAGIRRDLEVAQTDNSPRRMRNVGQVDIVALSTLIPQVYAAEPVLRAMSAVAGEPVHTCPWEPEQYVITHLERDGDTHGWHWDDYTFALVWVVDAPSYRHGGFVQCVPGTRWDKQDPDVNRQLLSRPVYSMEVFPGDIYLMKTNTTMHRVYPLRQGRRTIINMSYASTPDLAMQIDHRTMAYFSGVTADTM